MKKVTLLKIRESGTNILKYCIFTGTGKPTLATHNYIKWKVFHVLGLTDVWYIEDYTHIHMPSIPRHISLNAGQFLDYDNPFIQELLNAST